MVLSNEDLQSQVEALLGADILHSEINFDVLSIEVGADKIHFIIAQLQKDAMLRFEFLTLLGGVHYPEQINREFAVVYHLHSWKHKIRV